MLAGVSENMSNFGKSCINLKTNIVLREVNNFKISTQNLLFILNMNNAHWANSVTFLDFRAWILINDIFNLYKYRYKSSTNSETLARPQTFINSWAVKKFKHLEETRYIVVRFTRNMFWLIHVAYITVDAGVDLNFSGPQKIKVC